MKTNTKTAAQVAPARKAAAMKKAASASAQASPVRLLDKAEILAITGVSYPTLWAWMRSNKFPRSRVIDGSGGRSSKSVWRSDEIERWLDQLPQRRLKGDDAPTEAA